MGYEKARSRRRRLIRHWLRNRGTGQPATIDEIVGFLGRTACKIALGLIAFAALLSFLAPNESIEETLQITYICLAVGLILLVAEQVLAKITIRKRVDHSGNTQ